MSFSWALLGRCLNLGQWRESRCILMEIGKGWTRGLWAGHLHTFSLIPLPSMSHKRIWKRSRGEEVREMSPIRLFLNTLFWPLVSSFRESVSAIKAPSLSSLVKRWLEDLPSHNFIILLQNFPVFSHLSYRVQNFHLWIWIFNSTSSLCEWRASVWLHSS